MIYRRYMWEDTIYICKDPSSPICKLMNEENFDFVLLIITVLYSIIDV